jgi:hypothetical protein
MTITNELTAVLAAHAPRIAEYYREQTRRLFARHALLALINQIADRAQSSSVSEPYTLNEEKLAAYADNAAKELVSAWIGKIEQKVGELESPEVCHVNDYAYLITGTRCGHAVSINQNMIINVSKRGVMFNQFPARITLDGKKISAAAYAKMAN